VDGIVSLVRSDVHRAIIYEPQDTSTAMQLAEATAGFNVDSIDEISSGGGSLGGAGGGGTGSSNSGATNSSLDTADSGTESLSLRRPLGVYGTLQELQIDVLRERPQYEVDSTGAVVAATGTGGITTVLYALGQGSTAIGEGFSSRGGTLATGLVRQEVNRDLLNWATQTGAAAMVAGTPQLVAPEVTQLEFRYFDGTQLLETWDSELLEGQMPQAIEVRMWLLVEGENNGDATSRRQSLPYVVTIALPGTWNATDASLAGTSTSAASDTTSDGTSSAGSSATSGGNR
jgi:hypothetical protein